MEEYFNVALLYDELKLEDDPLTGYAEQGQYWPQGSRRSRVCDQQIKLPTALALVPRFLRSRPWIWPRRHPSSLPLEFLSGETAEAHDELSFRDPGTKLGVSRSCTAGRRAHDPNGLVRAGRGARPAAAGYGVFFCPQVANGIRRAVV